MGCQILKQYFWPKYLSIYVFLTQLMCIAQFFFILVLFFPNTYLFLFSKIAHFAVRLRTKLVISVDQEDDGWESR